MNFKLNKNEVKELINDIYFIEEIWNNVNDVYTILILEDILEKGKISRKELLNLENKLEEFKKHYKFYIKNNLTNYNPETILRIEKYYKYFSNIHSEILNAIELSC